MFHTGTGTTGRLEIAVTQRLQLHRSSDVDLAPHGYAFWETTWIQDAKIAENLL